MAPWYQTWFGEAYKTLYPHRDADEARGQIRFLTQAIACQSHWKILDVGCGNGRHLAAFHELGLKHAVGLDLSATLLRDARLAGHAVTRGDMRRLPFPSGYFDLIASLFTSFGYFAKSDQDWEALHGFAERLKPGGYLFLDLPNREHVLANLVTRDERQIDSIQVVQERRVEAHADGDQVVKRILMHAADGSTEVFEERVRLYGQSHLEAAAAKCGLQIQRLFGDEKGGDYHPDQSPRMAMLFRRRSP